MEENIQTNTKQPWIVLVMACFLSSASIGFILNMVGLFYIPVSEDLGILTGEFALHFTICAIAIAVFSLTVPSLFKMIGMKATMSIGVALAFIGTAGMAFTESLGIFYILGGIRGAGAALFSIVPLTILINNWFDKKTGLSLSIMNAFGGIIGVVFSPIMTWFITSFGWKNAFIFNGFLIILFALPALIYPYSLNPRDSGYAPYGYINTLNETNHSTGLNRDNVSKFSFTNLAFITLLIFSILHASIVGVTSHLPAFGESIGMAPQSAALLMSSLMLGNIVFKLAMGQLADMVGVVKATVTLIAINAVGILLLIFSRNIFLLNVGAFLFGSVYAVVSITFSMLGTKYFGRVVSNRIFPIISFALNIGTALAVSGVGYIYDFTGSYMPAFSLSMIFHVINIGLLFIGVWYTNKASKV